MRLTRRELLRKFSLSVATFLLAHRIAFPQKKLEELIQKRIPSSGALLPAIGMGTWITFNVGENAALRADRTDVLREFFKGGGGLIDSSPMYGSSEEVVGHGLRKLGYPKELFAATKVWTSSASEGIEQIERSRELWGIQVFDLFQVHNLVGWQHHLKTLFRLKSEGRIKYVGITTSHGRRHDEMERIMRSEPLDFVQLTYNITHRETEDRLLGLARDRNIAVIANRPYDGGDLVRSLKRRPLPPWAPEAGARNWAEFLLKFIVSHPSITCAIPATSQVTHMRENMGACFGALPDAATRGRMARFVENL